jgi:hypothetical protein
MNGRIQLQRRWWFSREMGSVAPADEVVDRQGESVTPGVREMACRENQGATSFAKAADNLARMAQIKLSGEQLRLVVEKEGRTVLGVQQAGTLDPAWTAADCAVVEEGRVMPQKTRVYRGRRFRPHLRRFSFTFARRFSFSACVIIGTIFTNPRGCLGSPSSTR